MKVLQINSVCGIKSTGRICTDIADILLQNGHECRIAYGREYVPKKYSKYAVRIGTQYDVTLHGIKSRLFGGHGLGSRNATKKFIEWVKIYNPDIIHLHNLHGYYLDVDTLFKYLRKCGKKIIWTMHDCWAFTGHCAYFTAVSCEQWKENCHRCVQKKEYPKCYLNDNVSKNFRIKKTLFQDIPNLTIVTPSIWLADLVNKSFLKEYPVKIINNGIDKSIFRFIDSDFKKQYGLEGKKIILGVAGVWDRRKGINDFIKLDKLITDEYRIVLIGVNEKQKRKLGSKTVGIARTNSTEELAKWYSLADVLLNTTYEDNYPTVNLEAQACGTPVITYRTGGSPESIPENNVVEPGNLNAIREKLEECLEVSTIVQTKKQMSNSYLKLYTL